MTRFRILFVGMLLLLALDVHGGQGQPAGKDQSGDDLPPGAVARCGSLPRWRHDAVVAFAAFLPDGKSVLCVSHDGAVRIWEFPTGKEIRRIAASPHTVGALRAAAL